MPIARDIASKGGELYCYEPQRTVYYQLCGNIVINRLDNVRAFNCAVGNTTGEISIPKLDYNVTTNVGAFSINPKYRDAKAHELATTGQSEQVAIFALDSIAFEKLPCLIKIDVEGHELAVLQGAEQLLKKSGYPPILFEAWAADWYAEEKAKLFDYVQSLGYTITHIINDDYLAHR